MTTQNILTANFLDILFDGRNKNYGAYDLRKNYNKRLAKALAGMLAICLVFTMGSIFASSRKTERNLVKLTDFDLTVYKVKDDPKSEVPKEQLKAKAAQVVRTVVYNVPIIAPNEDVSEDNQLQPIEDGVKIGSANISGKEGGDGYVLGSPVEGSIIGAGDANPKTVEEEGVFYHVEVAAQFPGGFEAWKKYLEKNLNAGLPAENGAQAGKYTVMVSFVVDKEGNISDVKAENAPGFGTEAEAIKIIKKGPKWQPAIQNGRKVAYRAMQQVTFQVDDNG